MFFRGLACWCKITKKLQPQATAGTRLAGVLFFSVLVHATKSKSISTAVSTAVAAGTQCTRNASCRKSWEVGSVGRCDSTPQHHKRPHVTPVFFLRLIQRWLNRWCWICFSVHGLACWCKITKKLQLQATAGTRLAGVLFFSVLVHSTKSISTASAQQSAQQ